MPRTSDTKDSMAGKEATAYAKGSEAFRTRSLGILNAPGAAARPDLALALATQTNVSIADATRILAAVSGKGMFAHLNTDRARAGFARMQTAAASTADPGTASDASALAASVLSIARANGAGF